MTTGLSFFVTTVNTTDGEASNPRAFYRLILSKKMRRGGFSCARSCNVLGPLRALSSAKPF